jgi:hypothetical protein
MNLRVALLVAIALFGASAAAEEGRKLPKIGELWFQDQRGAARYQRVFRDTLRDLGYVDGKTAVFVARFACGDQAKLPGLFKEAGE